MLSNSSQLTTIKNLETPIKISNFLYFYDLVFIIGYTFVTYQLLSSHVHPKFRTLFLINCIVWGIFLICPAVGNFKRPNWKNILITLFNMNGNRIYKGERKETKDYAIREIKQEYYKKNEHLTRN